MGTSLLLGLVRLRSVVVFSTILVLAFGGWRLFDQKLDLYPEFAGPIVEIQTEAQGLAAAEVESLITVPLEEMLSGVPWITSMQSNSVAGVSSIVLHLEPGADLMRVRQMTQERLHHASALPKVSKPPTMLQPVSVLNRSNVIGLSSETMSLIDMSVLARWKIKPRLLGVPGVANVSIWGERSRQLQVLVDPVRLNELGVALSDVIKATGDSLWSSPLSYLQASTPGNGGFIDTPNQRFDVRHILPISSPEDLAKISFVSAKGQKHTLGDVASVIEGHQPLFGDAVINGKTGLMFVIEKFPGADTSAVTAGVEKAMAALAPALPGVVVDTNLYRPGSYIEEARGNLAQTALLGLGAALALMLLLTFDVRRTLIVGVGAATATLATIYVVRMTGVATNTMTIVGLWMATLVAISHMSTVVSNYQQNASSGDANLDAVSSVTSRIDSSTIALIGILFAGFAVLLMSTVVVELWRPAVSAFILGVGLSYLVSAVVLPSLIVYLSPRRSGHLGDTSLIGRFDEWLRHSLKGALAKPSTWLWTAAAASAVTLAALFLLPKAYVPDFSERNFVVQINATPGTSLAKMQTDVQTVMAAVKELPGVSGVAAQIGRAELSDRISDVSAAEILVNIDTTVDREASLASIRDVIAKNASIAGEKVLVDSYSAIRIAAQVNSSSLPVEVRLHGPDDGQLAQRAEELRVALASIPGLVEPKVLSAPMEENVEIEVKLAAAAEFGLKPGDVRRAASILISGLQVGTLFEGQKIFDVVVIGKPGTYMDATSVEKILIVTPTGKAIELGQVAEIRKVASANIITREGASRYAVISAGISGPASKVRDDVKTTIAAFVFPVGFNADLVPSQEEATSGDRKIWYEILAVLAVLFLAALKLIGGWNRAVLLFLLAPSALLGGMVAPLLEGTIMAGHLAGLAVLAALTYSGLLLIAEQPDVSRLSGSGRSLTGPLLTAAAILGVCIAVIIKGEAGGLELLHPMSVVILLGLPTILVYLAFAAPAVVLSTAVNAQVDILGDRKGGTVHAAT
jgi:multidrug efflux pump subunit AcrB